MNDRQPTHVPEADAKQILARAAQLDESEGQSVSVADLKAAALEAGISPRSLEQAMMEHGSVKTGADSESRSVVHGRISKILIVMATLLTLAFAGIARVRSAPPTAPPEIILPEAR